jgi:outer membrane protein OmpA-like peptidoglycan-associated protein
MKPADSLNPVEAVAKPEEPSAGEWHRLRSLLFADEQASLKALAAKVGDRASLASSVAGVLSEAAAIRSRHDDSITRVLAPIVETSLQQSVRKNPQPLVDALYPIMGPAIRRSISEALADMMQRFNGAVEQSLSPRALKWRFDAWRTGQSYATVVLLKTLVYRVEQVFLIHRKTGLLLGHVQADQIVAQDPDMVSGMLTAIRDFVSDSFHVADEDGVDAIRIGNLSVQVRVGPKAVLAAVVRGSAPERLRVQLSETLEGIHRSHATALNQFAGDTAPFATVERSLRPCLSAQTRAKQPRMPWRAYMVLGLIALVVGWAAIARYETATGWHQILDELKQEPGLIVLESGQGGARTIQGLRDPLARNPLEIIGAERVRQYGIVWDWKPYLSMEAPFLLRRARQALNPPKEITLRLNGDVLQASGVAPPSWVREARSRAPFILGIRAFDDGSVVLAGQDSLERARQMLTSAALYFEPGSDALSDARRAKLDTLLPSLIALRDGTAALQVGYSIEIVGRADTPGTTAFNLHLSQSRADTVRQYLIARGVPAEHLHARGIGAIELASATSPANAEPAEHRDSLDTERRVNFEVILDQKERQMDATR